MPDPTSDPAHPAATGARIDSADAADDAGSRRVLAAAEAATDASRDAETARQSASATSMFAAEATGSVAAVATTAREQTANTVAAAAAETATLASRAALAVEAAAAAKAVIVADAALAALEAIAAQLPDGADHVVARLAATSVAATVAAAALAQEQSTADAAELVAAAVSLAAAATALAADRAATTVARAAGSAAARAEVFADSSILTETASGRAVESTAHVADLALRAVAALDQPALVDELLRALRGHELRLHYQPIYDTFTGALVAVEALLRWQHPVRGLLPPVEFIDVAERHPLTAPIGDWVIRTAIDQAVSWRGLLGPASPRIWVNVSCEQIGNGHLPRLVERLLTERDLPAEKLGVEVTERQLARHVDTVATDLVDLHNLGVALAVDDFGTGYASLDYLRRFEFDEIKIDRSFISGLGRDATDTAVAASVIALGRSLGLSVVAEGVETQTQLDALRELGCAGSQGYLLHRPSPANVITALLTAVPLHRH